MRNFDERKAEILRRSNERIKKRKKIKNIILSVFLCVFAVATVFILKPKMFSTKKSSLDENILPETSYKSDSFELEIKSNRKAINRKSGAEAENVYNFIINFFDADDAEALEGEAYASGVTADSSHSYDYKTEYVLTFKSKNVKEKEYVLKDGILTEKISGQAVKLSDTQINELLLLLEVQ